MTGTKLNDKLFVKKISGNQSSAYHQMYLECINQPFKWEGQIVYLMETAEPINDQFPVSKKFYVNEEGYWYQYYLGYNNKESNYSEYEYTEE